MNDVLSSEDLHPLRCIVQDIKQQWKKGQPINARAAIDSHPELASIKTLVLDLGYEEYSRRRERGEEVDPEEFCNRFPRFRTALRELLDLHRGLAQLDGRLPELPLYHWPQAGEDVSGFAILRELGRGSFARVYLATETNVGNRPVALKLTLEGGSEAHILGRLPHPNVIHVNSADEDERTGQTRLCMPFLGAATLHDLLLLAYPKLDAVPPNRASVILDTVVAAGKPDDPPAQVEPSASLPPDVLRNGTYSEGVAELGRQLADALAFVHRGGVYHRDLKPTNILLTPGGRPVLLDFNLAKDGLFAAARLGGTLPYMAPEQIRAILDGGIVPAGLDSLSDQFGLGVILYELLTGRLPFGAVPQDAEPKEYGPILLDGQRRGCVSLRSLNPAVPLELASIVERCLAFQSEDRHTDVAALGNALKKFLARSRPMPRQWRSWRYAVGAAALLVAGFVTAAVLRPNQNSAPPKGNGLQELDTPEKMFVEAHKRMLVGDDAHALVLLQQVAKERPKDGRVEACMAYCMINKGQNDFAAGFSEEARKKGFENAALFNNLGVALLRQKDSELVDAYKAFSRAIELDPGLRVAHQNRSLVFLKKPTSLELLPQARRDNASARTLGQPTAELYYQAALLDCFDKKPDEAMSHVVNAVRSGAPRGVLESDPFLRRILGKRQDFKDQVTKAVPGRAFPESSRLVDPAKELSE